MLKSFTDSELSLLRSYPRLSTAEIAGTLGVSMRAVYDWLIILGIPRNHVRHQALMATQNDPRHCADCGIILAAAARMDGHGWDGRCRYCVSVAEGSPMRWEGQPSGDDPCLKVFESIGMACGRDDR